MSIKYDGANSLTKLVQLIKAKLATKSDTGHTHAASDVTSGTLPVAYGGTGASNAAGALSSLGAAPASHTHDYADVDTADGEQWYPTFIRSSWSTTSDESTLPVTPCFVLSTSDMGLYWCDGQ